MLAVGHRVAPDVGAEEEDDDDEGDVAMAKRAQGDALLATRAHKEIKKACDYVLVVTLLGAPRDLAAKWEPLRLHSVGPRALRTLAEEARPKPKKAALPKREAKFEVTQRTLVVKVGGQPRPKGRAPSNDQGEQLTWSFGRGKWVDCSSGGRGTYKGARQTPGEAEAVLAAVSYTHLTLPTILLV